MGWRETFGVMPKDSNSSTHNTHYMHNSETVDNSAYFAHSAKANRHDYDVPLMKIILELAEELPISAEEIYNSLSLEDIQDWKRGELEIDTLETFARSLIDRRLMDEGKVPDYYNKVATCSQCGPIWLWASTQVLGCPWCWNRVSNKPIPRPVNVQCIDCTHFRPKELHSHLGHCVKGSAEQSEELWDTEKRYCVKFLRK